MLSVGEEDTPVEARLKVQRVAGEGCLWGDNDNDTLSSN